MPRGAAAPSATMAGVVWHPASQDFPMKHTFLAPMASGYKYAEGGVNLAMLPAGGSLSDGVRVLQVERACACEAVRWTEELTGRCATAHCTAHVFISRDATTHSPTCVPIGATKRSSPLIGSYVCLKEIMESK